VTYESRRGMSASISKRISHWLTTCVVRCCADELAALEMALTQRQPPAGLVHHSDRGVQYASESYRQRLAQAGVVPSMSRRGNGYDNALMESFWSSRKRELVPRAHFATRQQAGAAIFEWIEIFYNRERLHSALGYKSPVDFETNLN